MTFGSDKVEFSAVPWQDLSKDQLFDILKLRSDVFVVEQKCIYPDLDLSDRESIHIIGTVENQLCGYARLYETTRLHIGRVLVPPNFRSYGFGKLIMVEALKQARHIDQQKEIELSAQVYLHDFYTSIGFKAIGKMYLEDGIPHLKMLYQ